MPHAFERFRADGETRIAYETELTVVAAMVAEGLPAGPDRKAAWPILAQLVGGVVLSRAVQDEALAAHQGSITRPSGGHELL
jgi:hypothetical protein